MKIMKKIGLGVVACLMAVFGVLGCCQETALAANACDSNVPEAVRASAGCNEDNDEESLSNSIVKILNRIIEFIAIVAVIFVIIGGVKYMTSNGEASKLTSAKQTILYALIGLGICALAFAIVNFVILKILSNGSTSA